MIKQYLENEAISMLGRLDMQQPFSLSIPMVAAASVSDDAFRLITDHLVSGNRELKHRVNGFIQKLRNKKFSNAADAQSEYALLKLRFNDILDQLDIFADVLTQRSEHRVGVWVAGLDVLATDTLNVGFQLFEPPPIICFLERGHGAAIRKARTRLPGGDLNPVGIIQVPRERMVGSGIASSLIHEVGHQAAASLDLITSLRDAIKAKSRNSSPDKKQAWYLFDRWISEIVADFWAMGHLGIGASQGLMNVVSLPQYFMFRIKLDDPHPFPWIRVKLSLAFGEKLFPDPQWQRFQKLWQSLYPMDSINAEKKKIIEGIEKTIPEFTDLMIKHQTQKTKGMALVDVLPIEGRSPSELRNYHKQWQNQLSRMENAKPSLVFAVIGQARADNQISASQESMLLSKLLTKWALARSENRTLVKPVEKPQEEFSLFNF